MSLASNNNTTEDLQAVMRRKRFLLEPFPREQDTKNETDARNLCVAAFKKARRAGVLLHELVENSVKMAMVESFASAVFAEEGNYLTIVSVGNGRDIEGTIEFEDPTKLHSASEFVSTLANCYDRINACVIKVALYNHKRDAEGCLGDIEFNFTDLDIHEFTRHFNHLEAYLVEAWELETSAYPVV